MKYLKIYLLTTFFVAIALFSKAQNIITIHYIDQIDSIGKNAPGYPDTGNYILDRDLDFKNPTHYSNGIIDSANHISGRGWNPINFLGTFDGNNHSISNYFIYRSSFYLDINASSYPNFYDNSIYGTGFFRYNAGTIKNLQLLKYKLSGFIEFVNGNYNTKLISVGGAFVGCNAGTIDNCYADGIVNFNDFDNYVGGFVGKNNGLITNCGAKTSVTLAFVNGSSAAPFGGFLLLNLGANKIKNCFSTVNLLGNYVLAGNRLYQGWFEPGAFVWADYQTGGDSILNCYTTNTVLNFVGSTNYKTYKKTMYQDSNRTKYVNCYTPSNYISEVFDISNSKLVATFNSITNVTESYTAANFGTAAGAYQFNNIYLPILKNLENTRILSFQVDTLKNLYFKDLNGNLTKQANFLYDFRLDKSNRILPPTNFIFDSITINNTFITKDSFYGYQLKNIYPNDTIIIKLNNAFKLISKIEQLDSIGKFSKYALDNNYLLLNNLDFTNASNYSTGIVNTQFTTGTGFTPITNFTGIFNGNGFSIINLKINSNADTIGFFKKIDKGGRLYKLNITNAQVIGNNVVGILAGLVNKEAIIEECYVSGIDSGINNVGGLAGLNYGLIINTISKASVKGANSVGGFVGLNNYGEINNSFINGSVTATGNGGLFAGVNDNAKIMNCYAWGTINDSVKIGAFLYENKNGATISNSYSVIKNSQFILNNSAISTNNKVGATLKTLRNELGNSNAYLFQSNYYLPYLYKLNTTQLIDSQYTTLAELKLYKDTVYFEYLNYNTDTALPILYNNTKTLVPTNVKGTPYPLTYKLFTPYSWLNLDINNGNLTINNNAPIGVYNLKISINSIFDTFYRNISLLINPSPIVNYSYSNDSVAFIQSAGKSGLPTITNTGFPIKYKFISNVPNYIFIDSITGEISWTKKLVSGIHKLTIQAADSFSFFNKIFTLNILAYPNAIFQSNYVYTSKQIGTGPNGDYINLPALNIDSVYTVETWFKLNANTGTNYPFIYSFGGWTNGLIMNNSANRELIVKSWNNEVPTGFNVTAGTWVHLAVVVNGSNTKVYANGNLVNVNQILTPTINNRWLNNRIGNGQDAGSISTTLGSFKDFRIWKVARPIDSIIKYKDTFINENDTNLYYYLPLTNDIANNINNGKILNNAAISLNANTGVSTINSIAAQYTIDSSNINIDKLILNGTYKDTLSSNEIIQYNIDNGITWIDVPASNNQFRFILNNFKGGIILVRSNLGNRAFNNINIVKPPTNFYYAKNRIDTFNFQAGETPIPNINKGGSLNLKFRLLNNVNTTISVDSITGVIKWSALTDVGIYNIKVRATNELGYVDTSIILNIYRPIFNEAKLYSNNSFQTTNLGIGGTGIGGDFIKIPTINLINSNYTIETWFKFKEDTIIGFKRIFDFGQNLVISSTNILLCFKSRSPISSPVIFFFAGAGQQADISIPASINIKNWNHYALVLNGTTASLYINGNLLGSYTGLKSTANYTTNFIGRPNDNNATTLGNWQDFRIWNKARTPQEIKNYFKTRLVKYEDSLLYNLSLNGKYTSSVDYLVNGTKLPNDAISKDAIIDSAIITSSNNNGARFVFDSTNQKLYGTITNELASGDSIQISYDNGDNWINADTVVQNTWVASLPIPFIYGNIQIRSKLVNRNFNNFNVKIKPSYLIYSPNLYSSSEGVADSTNAPTILVSTPLNYILKTNKNGYTINNLTGRIRWNNTLLTNKDTLLVTAKNDIDSISTQVFVNIGDSITDFNYGVDTFKIHYNTKDSSTLPITTGSGVKTYSIIGAYNTGISINANTGRIYVADTLGIGIYNVTIQARNIFNSKNTNVVIKILPNIPIIGYADTFFSIYFNDIGTSNNAIVNKTGVTNTFKIISENNPNIIINSNTGEIMNNPKLYNGIYNLQVEMSNEAGADTTNFTIIVKNYVDTVHGFYNSVFSKSIYATALTGDYISLPRLDLKNTSYTIETWFKFNGYNGAGATISSFIRIFDFNKDNPPTGALNSNILLCFANGSTIANPTLLVFAGNGQNVVNVPANNNVNIANWNHYALVYNTSGTTASLYINGVLVSANIPAAASTQDFLSSYLGASSDNSFSTIGSYKEFKIWKRALSTQEINDEYQTITNTFKYKLYYYLPLEKYNKTKQNILNNTPIINASTATGANPNSAVVRSLNDSSASYLLDTNTNIVFGNIKDSLNNNEFIQIKINNEPEWYNATVKNNNWFYNIKINSEINQINVRGYDSLNGIITRTFNSLFLDNKIRNLNYSENPKIINYKENAHSVQPTYISPSTVKFKLINNPYPNSFSIDSNFGSINILNTLPAGMHILTVEASSLYDTTTINYKVTVLGIKPSGLSYPNKIITYYTDLINAQPTLNEAGGLNVKYTMRNAPTGLIIDTNTGVITASNELQVGDYKIQINVSNEIGYDSNFLNIEFKSFVDTIFGLLANTTQFTTNALNENGDKIILPNLNLDSSYTVETWFKLDPNTGTFYPFIYAFGGWNNGLIFNNQSGNNRTLIVKSWGVEANTGIIILPNVWNHFTVVVNGRNTKVYINGQLRREFTSFGVPTTHNQFVNNKIGTGEGANSYISTTLGLFKEFKIWSKARTTEEIGTNFTNQHIILDTNLVYFLPLSNSLTNQKIPNNTNLIGTNPLNAQNFQNSTIISVNNSGAKYTNDTFNRKLYGTIKNPLANNEILQFTLDGQNWDAVTEWEGKVWTVIIPSSFRGGVIRVRSIINNEVTNRAFNTASYFNVADTPTNIRVFVDNNNNNINVRFTPPNFIGGVDTISYYNIKLIQGNTTTNFTTKDTNYIINNVLDNTNYQVQVSVVNAVGSSELTTSISVTTNPSPIITTSNSDGGFIENTKMVKYGVNYRITFLPFNGYKVDSLFIDNVYTPVADTSTGFIFQHIITNHTIHVVFAKRVYTIQTQINQNGTISNAVNAYYGDSVVVTYSPNNGYRIDSIYIDGVYNPILSTSNLNTYTFKDINISHTFKVVITIIKFRINANITSGGIINKNILANYGSNYQVTYSIKPGYTFDSLFVNNIYVPDSINSYTFTNILGDSSIFIKLKLIIYSISLNIVNAGTVTPNKDTTVTVIDTITYNFVNGNNLYVDSVIVNGTNQINRRFYTFKNTISNQILRVVFKTKPENTSNIEANVLTDGGSITPSGNIFVSNGSGQQFLITNNPGYALDKIWVNNTKVDSINSYTFYNVSGDSAIEVYFKIDTFLITSNYNNGGAINPAGTNKITYFDSLVYTITPNIGYYLDSLFIDNNLITNVSQYTFKNVLKNTSIRALFKQKTFTIKASSNEGGTISSTGIDTVLYGSNISYQITAKDGYYLDSLIVDEKSVEKSNQYYFLNVLANHTIKVVFKKNKYTISAIALANGKISPAGDTLLFYNDSITYTILPNIGYNIESVLLDGSPININNNTITLQNIRAGHTIQVSFIIKKFTINITKGLNGQTSPVASSIQINYGADTNILIIPDNGYSIDTLIIDGVITPEKYVIGFTRVDMNHTIYVTFKNVPIVKTYTILASSNNGGVISPAGTSVVNSGNNISYTITPNNGYLLDSLIVDNIKVTNATTYTFSNVTTNHTIKAVFKIDCSNYTKRTPIIVRTNNNLSSDLTFASYTWFRDGVLQSTLNNNLYTPSVAGVYTLMGTESTTCLSNLSKKYYYASTCITPTGRVGNGAYIQGNIIGDNSQIIVKWCSEILQENIIIRVIDLNGVLLNEQTIPASLGTYIINKQSIKSKQYLIQVIDSKGDLLQLSDVINY